ncbi:hypothetical protein BH09SUM1_BH09SUM1_01100 [soil metagenome]
MTHPSENPKSPVTGQDPPPPKPIEAEVAMRWTPSNMIRLIAANDPRFKTVEFKEGMNVILAEETEKSTRKDTTNGAGKSLLVDIIHLLMAGKRKDTGLEPSELDEMIFSMKLRLDGKEYEVERALKSNTVVIFGDFAGWPIKPVPRKEGGGAELKLGQWSAILGFFMFGLSITSDGEDAGALPSFRSLFSFLARRQRDQGFAEPFTFHRNMAEDEKQRCNTFLLGLGVEYASKFAKLRQKQKHLGAVKKALKSGLLPGVNASIGKVEAEVAALEELIASRAGALQSFRVVEQYSDVEVEADLLTGKMHGLEEQIIDYQGMLAHYERSFVEERDPGQSDVAALYEQAGVVFGDQVIRRLEEVASFHHRLVENRRQFLGEEMQQLRRQIEQAQAAVRKLDSRRSELLAVLDSGGALQEFSRLQEEQSRRLGRLEQLRGEVTKLRELEDGKNAIEVERATLKQNARRDLDERKPIREKARKTFESYSKELYGEAGGLLLIDLKDDGLGYEFDTEIPRSGSEGIEMMKIFCYDMTLAALLSSRDPRPGLLIHDSSIFHPSDHRQVASALRLAAKESLHFGYQYICLLNRDQIPFEDLRDINLESFIRLKLNDQETGGLLGFRIKEGT